MTARQRRHRALRPLSIAEPSRGDSHRVHYVSACELTEGDIVAYLGAWYRILTSKPYGIHGWEIFAQKLLTPDLETISTRRFAMVEPTKSGEWRFMVSRRSPFWMLGVTDAEKARISK